MTKEFYHLQLSEMLADEKKYTLLKGDPTRNYRQDLINLADYGFDNRVLTKKKGDTWYLVLVGYQQFTPFQRSTKKTCPPPPSSAYRE